MKQLKHTILTILSVSAFSFSVAREAAQPKPLSFIENKGQIVDQHGKHRSDIDFKAEAGGMVMFVGDAQLHYQWYRDNAKGKSENAKEDDIPLAPFEGGMLGFPFEGNNAKSPSGDLGVHSPFEGGVRQSRTGDVNSRTDIYRLDVELIGANKNAELITEDRQEYTENYYLPQCPDGAIAHSYSRVIYKNVYPNIDWVIYTNSKFKIQNSKEGTIIDHKSSISNELKYDFIVHPGGDYRDIQIQYNGATKIELKDGALVANTPFGGVSENAPYTYDADTKNEIISKFVLNGNILSYSIVPPSGDGRGFVIDPSLGWATYYGGTADDDGAAVATDPSGNVYMTGQTKSSTNIATSGAYQTSYSSLWDLYLVKFSIAGARQWATYYGGTADDLLPRLATDNTGNVYMTCVTTGSTGLATSGSHQPSYGGSTVNNPAANDGVLAKFNSAGVRQWATYYGDTADDNINTVACDVAGNIYIGGSTQSVNTIATSGVYMTTPSQGFFAKFNPSGVRQWGSYYPSNINSICIDNTSNVFVGGVATVTASGISSSGAHQLSYGGGTSDGFVAKFNSSATMRAWGTYYGGSGLDVVRGMFCDNFGNLYITGSTSSTTAIASTGAYQTAFAGSYDAYIAKFNTAGARIWATYYGGANDDGAMSLTTTPDGNIYIAGYTESLSGIATTNGYKTSGDLNGELFLAIFDASGNRNWATYYGGPSNEMYSSAAYSGVYGNILATDLVNGRIYICSNTFSSSNVATSGSYQSSFAGGNQIGDGLLVQFNADTSVYVVQPYIDTFKCVGDSLHVAYGVTQNFRSTNTFTLQLSNASGSFASPTTLATVSGGAPGTFHCIVPNVTNGTGYRLRVLGSAPADTSEDNLFNIRIQSYPTTPVASYNNPVCSGNTLNLASTNSTSGVVWSWTGPGSYTASTQNTSITNAQTTHSGDYIVTANLNGCVRKDTVTVTVNQTPAKPTVGSNTPLCSGNTLNLTTSSTTSGVSWIWAGPNSWGSNQQNPSISNINTNGTGYYVATAILGSCSSKDSTQVTVNPGPTINVYANPNDSVCAGSSITLVALVTNGGTGPSYQWYKNSSIISGATGSSYNTIPANGDVYYCKFTPGAGTGCNGAINSGNIPITVLPYTTPSISITAAPDTNIWQGLMVNFTASVTNCNNPAYQWKLNGNDVSGATSSTWGAATLADNNLVSCVLTCNDFCPNPKNPESNKLRMHVSTGINNTTNALSTVNIYPNPMHDELHIEGISKGTRIQLYDVLGRGVYNTVTTEITHIIGTASLHTGTYILQLTDAAGNRGSYKVVRE